MFYSSHKKEMTTKEKGRKINQKKEKKNMDEALPRLKGRPKIKYKGETWSPIKVHNGI